MSNDILEQELQNIYTKINMLNQGNEVLFAILSVFLTVLTSYYGGLIDTLNLWGVSFGTVFTLWELQSFLGYHRTTKPNPKPANFVKQHKLTLATYYGEIFGKTTYSGIQAFGILSMTSLCIYLSLSITNKVENRLWGPMLLIFLLILALMTFIDEQRIITLFAEFNRKVSANGNSTSFQHVDLNKIIGSILGFLSVIFIISGSLWATKEVLALVYFEVTESPGDYLFPILLLLLFFQYVLVWALMGKINKNQVRRDLTNALICLQNLQYKPSSGNETSVDLIALCVKYTHFLKLTPLKILEFYFYLPHPLYEYKLKQENYEKSEH